MTTEIKWDDLRYHVEKGDLKEWSETLRALDTARQLAGDVGEDNKSGRWIAKKRGYGWDCSECGYEMWTYGSKNYCPNCGARMEVEA